LGLTLALLPHLPHLPVWLWLGWPLLIAWRGWLGQRNRPLPPRWLLAVLTVAVGGGVWLHYHALFGRDPGVALLAAMVALKSLESRTRRDGQVLLVLGYFLVMANLLYDQSPLLVAWLLLVVAVLLAGQVLLQHPQAAVPTGSLLRLTGRLLLEGLPVMLILFVLFPRIPGPLWGLPKDAYEGRTGLPEEMAPGTIDRLSQSDQVAFRARFQGPVPPPNQLYWRGPVLWRYDGRVWRRNDEPLYDQFTFQPVGEPVDYSVTLEPHGKHWLLALDLPARLPAGAAYTPSLQVVRRQPVNEVLRYEMRSYPRYHTGPLREPWQTQLPQRGNPKARQLAAEWRAPPSEPADIVRAALEMFRQQPFHYTLNPPLLGYENGIDEFLFGTRRGFCEHYAGSFVFLMRAAGVPARVVLGYQGGEFHDLGGYLIVRQSDAHAWAEVWLAGQGWVRVDPTAAVAPERVDQGLYAAVDNPDRLPLMARRDSAWLRNLALGWDYMNNAWNEWVLAYGPDRQREFLSSLGFGPVDWRGMTIAMVIGLGLVSLVIVGLQRWQQRRRQDPVARAYQRFCTKLARRGLVREATEGPLDFTERVAGQRPELATRVRLIGRLYARLRYGRAGEVAQVAQLQRLVRDLKVR
jgi:transglutaminase-like putative cysteine protease